MRTVNHSWKSGPRATNSVHAQGHSLCTCPGPLTWLVHAQGQTFLVATVLTLRARLSVDDTLLVPRTCELQGVTLHTAYKEFLQITSEMFYTKSNTRYIEDWTGELHTAHKELLQIRSKSYLYRFYHLQNSNDPISTDNSGIAISNSSSPPKAEKILICVVHSCTSQKNSDLKTLKPLGQSKWKILNEV